MHPLEQQVFADLDKYHMIPDGATVIAGVSGGADSVAMLLVLHAYVRSRLSQGFYKNVAIRTVHVEHGMRGEESLRDAAFVEELCAKLELPCEVRHIRMREEAKRRSMTLEEAGRACRYEIFRSMVLDAEKDRIAVAHNMDDQAETVLMNLIRGTGIRGMGGIVPVREKLIRPLLGVSRALIEDYLKQQGQTWCEDASNAETEFTRNKVRLELLPWMKAQINAGAAEHISRTAAFMREADDFIEKQAAREAELCCRFEDGQTVIDADRLRAFEPLLQKYLIRMAITRAAEKAADGERQGNGLKDVTAEHLAAICELAEKQSGRRLNLPGKMRAVRSGSDLVITFREEEQIKENGEVAITGSGEYSFLGNTFNAQIMPADADAVSENKYTKWLDYGTIQGVLSLRTRQSGDYIVTDANGGRTKLKKYMIDSKIPAQERGNVILIADGHRILWIVGYRISEDAKIKDSTHTMIRITVRDKTEE